MTILITKYSTPESPMINLVVPQDGTIRKVEIDCIVLNVHRAPGDIQATWFDWSGKLEVEIF